MEDVMDLTGVGVWSSHLRYGDRGESTEAAGELEELGYTALWFPDRGGAVFDAAAHLLAATSRATVATGVLNLWMHTPAETAAGYASLTGTYGDRFLLGVGVSHAESVDRAEPGRYRHPIGAMTGFLDALDAAEPPVPVAGRVLAALGPRMLEVSAKRARGVHSYLVTPEHTRRAREAVGGGALLLPEQTVILASGLEEARAIGADWVRRYLAARNYSASLLRLGFSPEDLTSVSDRLFDALIAWGDEEAIRRRVDEHRAAGADQVVIQVLTADENAFPREQWRRLAPALL
jgi:probable F420-dependent oxidoreductase